MASRSSSTCTRAARRSDEGFGVCAETRVSEPAIAAHRNTDPTLARIQLAPSSLTPNTDEGHGDAETRRFAWRNPDPCGSTQVNLVTKGHPLRCRLDPQHGPRRGRATRF